MPEIKNTFLKGKMNKDFDERLVPEGEYRDALNIEVSTSESADVGVVKNILGNHRLEDLIPSGFTCVGSIADEQTNKIYWFVSSYDTDAIIEFDVDLYSVSSTTPVAKPVFVDKYVGTPKAVLNFPNKIITGINIIDNLLFWTDNVNNPKKINIDDCKKGTVDLNTHTQLSFDKGSFHGLTINLITDDVDLSLNPFTLLSEGEKAWYDTKQLDAVLGTTAVVTGFDSGQHEVKHYRGDEFLGVKKIVAFDVPTAGEQEGTYFHAVDNFDDLNVDSAAWEKGDVIFGNDITVDIEERHITVIKPKPLSAPFVKINYEENVDSDSKIPNIFETKLPRFSYRYKYRDGEFSPFAPFTHPVFNAKYPKDTSVSNDTNIFYNKDNAYDIDEPHNKAMVNSIHSVELTDFVTPHTPEDVEEIEILYKQEESPNIYSISRVKRSHKDWHEPSNYQGLGFNIGLGKSEESNTGTYKAQGGLTKGKYTITTENIYAALPANQLLRPWDNVPKKALAQEVTGNRIVYGNYVQNYDLDKDTEILVSYDDRKGSLNSFESQGLRSIKSQRNYQLGVVYSDKYGRETPVLTSTGGAVNVPWQDDNNNKNASRSLQLNASVTNNFPEWVDSFKFFIKETSNPYYNLIMDRAWVTKSTYELDYTKGNLWISFPSSDRNKISEEDYIILKKKIGTGEEQVSTENKFKIIDIKNNAPDAIKFQLVNYGQIDQKGDNHITASVFTNTDRRMDKEVDTLQLSAEGWQDFINSGSTLFGGIPLEQDQSLSTSVSGPIRTTGLYISWRRLDSDGKGVSSKKYKITNGKFDTNYTLKLATPITKIDADIAHFDGNSALTNTNLHPDLIVQIEKRERKDEENFSGKFFVKISKNQVTDLIETGNSVDILDQFQVSTKRFSWYWQDDIAGSSQSAIYNSTDVSNYGLLNYFGENQTHSGADSIHDANNNVEGNTDANSANLKLTDYHDAWDGIETNFGPTFFIDSMHMAAGQSEASNYAKYSCITWSGCTSGESTSAEDSSWSYPPLKTWITDFKNISGLKNKLKSGSVWFNDDLISTSPLVDPQDDWRKKRVDGWVGPLQKVTRSTPTSTASINSNHINGLEGIVTTNNYHATGPRRWFSGITSNNTEHGVGSDTKTYSNNGEVDRHFMHLSFFAPGRDLHPDAFKDVNPTLFGKNSWAANLQGIWGGGVFTGQSKNKKFGTSNSHRHIMMEGNHDSNNNYRKLTPRPGVGVGYDLKYKELHARQWDPTFNKNGDPDNKIRDFIRNLHAGARFRFHKVASFVTTDTVASAVSNSTAVTLSTSYVDTGVLVGDTVSGDGVDTGTTVAAVNVGSSAIAITLSANATIAAGTLLKFTGTAIKRAASIDTEVYTIKKVAVKKLYNHTSWRKPYNRYVSGTYEDTSSVVFDYRSVETVALEYLNIVKPDGSIDSGNNTKRDNLKNKIKEFGKANNRRICYIIELDKNPADNTSFNPLDASKDIMTANYISEDFCDIEFLDPVKSVLLSDLSKFPAIWEVDPKKQEVDLDIYYEASSNIPVKINSKTNEMFAPIGCTVEILNSTITTSCILESWNGSTATFSPGFPKYFYDSVGDTDVEFDYSGLSFKFIREDGSYTVAEASTHSLDSATVDFKTEFKFEENIGQNLIAGLSWYNCFSFGNGVESNRIRDDFNEIFIANGVKASTTTQEIYEEERRAHGLIYSGIYNSNSSVNDLNQFIMAEKITKDLNPTFGSIQKLFQRRISLIAFCEDRVVSIVSNKDTLFNADGNPQLIASDRVLGDANPFAGEYGISTNPESFAQESFRSYFTDKQRGAVLRLSRDGLTPISKNGMHDWFRDNLTEYNSLIGTYDSYKEDYNLTLSNNSFSQNLLQDAYIEAGGDPITIDPTNRIVDGGVNSGVEFEYLYEAYNVLDVVPGPENNPFVWGSFIPESYALSASANITHHGEILKGSLQAEVIEQTNFDLYGAVTGYAPATYSTTLATSDTGISGNVITSDFPQVWSGLSTTSQNMGYDGNWQISGQGRTSPSGAHGIWYWNSIFPFENNNSNYASYVSSSWTVVNMDSDIKCDINKHDPSSVWNQYPSGGSSNMGWKFGKEDIFTLPQYPFGFKYYPAVQMVLTSRSVSVAMVDFEIYSGQRYLNNLTDKLDYRDAIVFDRPTNDAWIEWSNFGKDGTGDLVDNFNDPNVFHGSIFNGDELHVEIELGILPTFWAGGALSLGPNNNASDIHYDYIAAKYGSNYIQPKIELWDDATGAIISSSIIQDTSGLPVATGGSSETPYNAIHSSAYTAAGSDIDNANGYVNSGSVVFEDTYNYESLVGPSNATANGQPAEVSSSGNNNYFDVTSKSYTISASWKFQDSDSSNNNINSGISEKQVVENLKLRLQNIRTPYSGNWATGHPDTETLASALSGSTMDDVYSSAYGGLDPNGIASHLNMLREPMWFVKKIKIHKGHGITAPTDPGVNDLDIAILGVEEQPPVNIPAWTEVTHNYFNFPTTWSIVTNAEWSGAPGEENTTYTHANTSDIFGDDYPAVSVSSNFANTTPGQEMNPGALFSYVVPFGFDETTVDLGGYGTENPPGNTTNQSSISGATNFTASISNTSSYTSNTVLHDNQYIYVENYDSTSASDITHDITSEPWVAGNWYLVDVEYSDFVHGTDSGDIMVYGVASGTSFDDGEAINEEGVGLYGGDSSNAHCVLVPVIRNEYGLVGGGGDGKLVLRGIFKIHGDSWVLNNEPNKFTLRVLGCTGGVKINKIVTKKLIDTATAGTVDYWSNQVPSSSDPTHSFSNNSMYYKADKLCWEIEADSSGINLYHIWSQDLVNTNTLHQGPWDLFFTVSINPVTGIFSGSLSGVIAVSDTGVFRGAAFNKIKDVGNYKISFDLTDNSDGAGWKVYQEDLNGDYIEYTTADIETAIDSPWNVGDAGNKIQFHQDLGETSAQEYAISGISLTPLEQTILIGNIGSWNINGFDVNQVDPYIYLDSINNYFVFDDCPIQDDGTQFISITQQVNESTNQFDRYKISFNHGITTGEINIYYYNENGYGFKITGIDSSTPTNFEQIVSVGDDLWSPDQGTINGNDYSGYNSDLKNTFVIQAFDNGDDINGYIDNISMVRVYEDETIADKTVTFNESVNGWSSFKSFVPENGVSLSKKYFTFKNGKLWQHYIPKLNGATGSFNDNGFYIKTKAEEADNYNVFYGNSSYSSIKNVINQGSSTVKIFNTINYEGSQAYVAKPTQSQITLNNAIAWSSGDDILGWNCSEIKTDLDSGSVVEFIKKEGKWFNYIKGLNTSQVLDTSKFSVQGIGIVSSTQSSSFVLATPVAPSAPSAPAPGGGGGGGGSVY